MSTLEDSLGSYFCVKNCPLIVQQLQVTNDRFPKHWDLRERFKLYLIWMISLAYIFVKNGLPWGEEKVPPTPPTPPPPKKAPKERNNSKTRNFPKALLQFSHVPTFSPKQSLSLDRHCRSDWLKKIGLSRAFLTGPPSTFGYTWA